MIAALPGRYIAELLNFPGRKKGKKRKRNRRKGEEMKKGKEGKIEGEKGQWVRMALYRGRKGE